MSTIRGISYGILFGIAFYIVFENLGEISSWIVFYKKPVVLIIGILSAREHFVQRNVARSTWLGQLENLDFVKAWFILGNSSCHIPPDYRLSPFNCEKWEINIAGLETNFFTSKQIDDIGYCSIEKTVRIYQGFTFKVNHAVIVTKLGILSRAIVPNRKSKVAILDIHSQEVVVEAIVSSNTSELLHGYIYAPVEKILLPKDYEGLILFEGYLEHSLCTSVIWDNGGGAITFKRIYSSPYPRDSEKYLSSSCSAVSINFVINDVENFRKIAENEITITENWHKYLQEVDKKIDFESSEYKDLLIVNSIDIYRNLPAKLLNFYKWLQKNHYFSFVMKTDDDSIINIEALLNQLQRSSRFNSKKLLLWSKFRKNWFVNHVGKWADDDYRSDYYPSFPCGAAYILSQKTVTWLSDNSDSLFAYQGEDVSLGIWLSAINPDFIEDENFECGSGCTEKSYNRAQLEVDEIQRSWINFQKCKNLCSCKN